ncbi:M24 family metallopeptidase [Mesorhizobium australicum]|uniref:M24 family metallopeptidase n=1 Tax=Mesorhizobium australicum TaxID=536018 RepID=UPI00333D84A3
MHFELIDCRDKLAIAKIDGAQRDRHSITLRVAQDHEEPIGIGRFMDRVSASMTTYLTEDNIRAYPNTYVQSTTLLAYDFMADIVKEVGRERPRMAWRWEGNYYPASGHADLTRALPDAEFVDADLLVDWIRLVKSPAEVAIMRQAGQLADVARNRVIDTVQAGVRECDIEAAIYHQQVSCTAEFGGDYPCCPPDLCIGERSIASHAAWTDDPLPDSTVVNLELSGCRHRYQVNLARTIVVGKPSTAPQPAAPTCRRPKPSDPGPKIFAQCSSHHPPHESGC